MRNSKEIMEEVVAHAFDYAEAGLPVLTVHRPTAIGACSCGNLMCRSNGKHPRAHNGLYSATTDKTRLKEALAVDCPVNLGIATGCESGIFVLDVDQKSGGLESIRELQQEYGKLPTTPTVATGGGGEQYFFLMPQAGIGNAVGIIPGCDIRGNGGMVVAPPSLHKSGKKYSWLVPLQHGFAPAPAWLLVLINRPKHLAQNRVAQWRSLAASGAGEGCRNHSAASLAGHLLRKRTDPLVVLELVQCWNLARNTPPLPPSEVEATVKSICKSELKRRLND